MIKSLSFKPSIEEQLNAGSYTKEYERTSTVPEYDDTVDRPVFDWRSGTRDPLGYTPESEGDMSRWETIYGYDDEGFSDDGYGDIRSKLARDEDFEQQED